MYETEAKLFGSVINHCGQRVTERIPCGAPVLLSASSTDASLWNERYDFLTESYCSEYRATIREDGIPLFKARLQAELSLPSPDLRVQWGEGIYGPLRGKLRSHL